MLPLQNAVSSGITLSFKMLSFPVAVHSAVAEDNSGSTRIVCVGEVDGSEHTPSPVSMKYQCQVCARTGRADQFPRAREVGAGLVVIPAEVLAAERAAGEMTKKQMSITVHPASQVTSILMPSGKSYYLAIRGPKGLPAGANLVEAYTLLAQLIRSQPDVAFMTKLTMRTSQSLFRLDVAGEGTLILRQMADADLVRAHPVIDSGSIELDARTLQLAQVMVSQQLEPFNVNEHGVSRAQVIEAYAATQTPQVPETAAVVAMESNVLSLMEALEQAVGPVKRQRAPRKTAARAATPRASNPAPAAPVNAVPVARKRVAKKASVRTPKAS